MLTLMNWWLKLAKIALFLALAVAVLVFYHYPIRHLLYGVAHRITPGNLHLVLSAIAWPAVVVVAVFLYREPIRAFIARMILKLKVGDKSLEFSPLFDEGKSAVAPPQPPMEGGVPFADRLRNCPANVFWVGSDLANMINVIYRGADRNRILNMYRQSNHHMKVLGLKNTPLHARFMRLYGGAEASLSTDWTPARREQDAREVTSIRGEIAALIENSQPGFSGDPKTRECLQTPRNIKSSDLS
jgi:hypothetical protein